MKKLILILSIFAFFAKGIYSQNTEFYDFVLERIVTRTPAGEYLNKQVVEYDDVNNLLIKRWYFWDRNTKSWVVNRKFRYDNNNNDILYTFYLWNADTNAWTLSHKYTFELGDSNIPILFTLYFRNNDAWQKMSQTKHDFSTTAANPMIYYSQIHNVQTGTWTRFGKHEIFYNDYSNIDFFIVYRKNPTTNLWQKTAKTGYIYDEHNRLIMKTQHLWNNEKNDWQLISTSHYYYSFRSRNYTAAGSLSDAVVFPNPATNYITIRGAESSALTVFDLSGRVVFRQESISENQIIPVATWNTGMYLVVIQTGSEKSVHKIIKR